MKKILVSSIAGLVLLLSVSTIGQSRLPLWKTLPAVSPMPAAESSGLARVNGVALYYAVFNRLGGNPVILLHGGLGSSDQWGDEVPLLEKTHKVIVIDTRGHGRSTLGTQPLSYALLASDVIGVMDHLQIEKGSIVGVSDGGIIGLLLAIHQPQRIDKLFIYGANFNNSDRPSQKPDPAMFARYKATVLANYRRVSPTPHNFPKLVSALRKMYSREPNIPPRDLQRITAPTVVADGQYEQFISRKHTQKLAQLIPNARLLIIPNVSHGGATQDPLRFHREVVKLLDGI